MSWFVVVVPFHYRRGDFVKARVNLPTRKSSNEGHQLALWSHTNGGIHFEVEARY